jgi:phage-related protein
MEELKILIKAVTSEAEKNLEGVRKELDKISDAAQETKVVDEVLRAIGKGALAAVAGVAALTTAMVALGKSSMEFRKVQAQLVAGFASVGLSADQALKTYKELYGFLGDAGQATEAANLLAQLTQEEEDLTEWTNILMGVYAKFPSSLPVESLAEAINHTAHLGEVQGTLSDALEWSGISVESFNAALANTNSLEERELLIRSTLNGLYSGAATAYSQANQALIAYNQSQVNLDRALLNATAYIVPLMTELNNLAAMLLAVLKPAFETVAAVIVVFVQWIMAAIKAIGIFFGVFSSGGENAKAISESVDKTAKSTFNLSKGVSGLNNGLNQAVKTAKELKRQTMGFDELNVMSSQTSASSGAGATGGAGAGVGAFEIPEIEIPDFSEIVIPEIDLGNFEEKVEKVREIMEGLLILVGAIAGGLLLWKLADFITEISAAHNIINNMSEGGHFYQKVFGDKAQEYLDGVSNTFKTVGGLLLVIAGAILLVKGYTDAWVNGIDWANFATMLAGIGLIVGGLALAFGPMAAAIGLVVGGIALLVVGIKDLITNGYSMEAVLTVAAGAIAVVIGLVWAFNAALLANPITWIVVGIMALVAAFVILWNECEGFRNFWIGLWEKAKELFAKFVESIQPAIDAIVFAFEEAWELIKVIWLDYLVPMFESAWELIKEVWNLVKPYFEAIWIGIKTAFSVVGTILSGYFKVAWSLIKGVWNIAVSWFTTIVENIGLAFGIVKDLLSGNFSEAWEKVKQIFSNVGSFFSDVVDTIKNTFSDIAQVVADTISGVVEKAINGVLSGAVKIINGFISAINVAISIINAIPGVNISKLSKLDVPQLATGGIANSATLALIGERGKEAVLPLENNTQWMDALAEKIAARNSSPSRIILKVDERELGYATINAINQNTKQTGGLKLQLV